MAIRKLSARQEYRRKQRGLVDVAPLLAEKFPQLKSMMVTLSYYSVDRSTKQGELKCTMDVSHTRCALWFECPRSACVGGDFDLTEVVAKAVADRRKLAKGEIRCHGALEKVERGPVPCDALLRYKLDLKYD